MEEVINKPDGQFKNILDDLVDYKKHVSKKDPLIKELSRPKLSSVKPAASLNSSSYSSAASSSPSASDSSASVSSTSSSSNSSSSSTSSASSTTSSASSTASSASSSPSQINQINGQNNSAQDYGTLEMAKMEDLGKKAKILEHHLAPSVLSATVSNNTKSSNSLNGNIKFNSNLSQNSAQRYTQNGLSDNSSAINEPGIATTSSANISSSSTGCWKTISAKRRKKPAEIVILAREIPGHIGNDDRSVEELANFIEVSVH